MDEEGPVDAVVRLIEFIGDDPTRPGLADTPTRVVRALAEMTAGLRVDPARHLARRFPNDGYGGPVGVGPFRYFSLCEHHLLPFFGEATLTYQPGPGNQIVGLSKLPRMFLDLARRPQVQERLTHEAVALLGEHLHPEWAEVVVTGRHMCMECRGVGVGAVTTTRAVIGNPVPGWDASRPSVCVDGGVQHAGGGTHVD